MKKILITGGVGFIGSNLSLYFLERGWSVTAFDNFSREGVEKNAEEIKAKGVRVLRGDIRNADDLRFVGDVDAAVNLAANTGLPLSIQNPMYDAAVNMMGALNVLEFARERGACVVQASTNKVYSERINDIAVLKNKRYELPTLQKGIDEQFPIDGLGRPHSPYGCSKLAADIYAQEYNSTFDVPTVVCRMSSIYGVRQMGAVEQGWIVWFMRAKMAGLPIEIFGDGFQVRDVLYIDDLCRLYFELVSNIERYRGGVFNVGGGAENTLSVLQLIDVLDAWSGSRTELKFKAWRAADHSIYVSNIEKVSRATGWKPEIGVDVGLRKTWWDLNHV